MPKYDVDVNGRTYEVDAPDPNTAWAWANQFVAAQEATRAARPGFFDAAGRGLESATLGGIRGLQMTAQPDNLALEQRMLESRGPSFTWEDVKSEFKAGDYGRGLSELWGLTKQSTGESLGFMAPALVTGKAAAALTPPVLPVVGPLAKPIAGALGTVAGLLPGMYGTNVERQAGEREAARQAGTPVPEWEFGKAATAAAGQTALDLITLRASGLHRVAGMGREEALAVARRELQELGAEGFARSLGVGTLRTMAAEVPTEITQQGLERWQAGLPLTGEDAMKEYEASAVGAALSSPVFGAVGRRVEVGHARRQEAALVAKEQQAQQQRAAAQAALQARHDAFNALSPGTQQEMPLTPFEGPMRPSGDFTPPTPESFTQERTNTANRLMNMQAEIDRLRQEGRIGEAAALKERYFQEEAKFNEMGGVTPGQLSKLRNDVAQTQEKLTKGQERLLSAQTKEEYDNVNKGLGKQQERLAQLTQQLQQVEAANAYTSPETGGAQLQLDMERNEQAERIQAAIQSGNEYILGYDEVNALGVPRAGGAKRRISLLDLAQPEARVEARKIVEESAKNAEAKARFLQTLDRIDADIARAKEQATAAPTTSELQVDDTQQGVDFEATAAQEQAVDGITSAELEPEQQADPEYEAFLRERARQQAERVKSPAQRAAEAREAQMKAEGRWTDADEQRAREEEAMWAAQRQQEIEATPYGTQFELTAPGSMPVRSQQRQQEVEQVPPTMRDLATQYIAARNEKNAELMQAIETTAKSINPEQWKKTKYEYLTSGRKQAKLDFEGAAQPVPGDTRAGGQADVQRPAAEPSVGVPVQPEQPAAAQVEEPAGPGVGDVERPAGRRDAPEKPKRRTLKEKRDAVQEQKPDEGVLRREEPEMGLQEVGEGDAKPQEAAQEGKGEAEVDRAQLVKDLQDVSSKEGNSSAGQRARKYLLEARNGTGSPKEASDFVADYRIAAARAPKPKRVPAVQAPQPPKQKTIADYEAELDAEYERDDGPRQAVVTALENKIAAMQRGAGTVAKGVAADVAEAEDGSFSGSTDKPSGTTVAKVVSAIKRAFFDPSNFDNKVTVVQSVNDLPPAIARKFKEAEAKGLYGSAYFDGRRVYIVADQTPKSDILGVVLHDVGVHMGMKNLLGEELHKQLLNQIEKWAKPGTGLEHQIAARALARAGVNEKAGVASDDEVLAYFVEEAVAAGINPTALKGASPLTQWFRKLWAAAKAAIRRLGINPDKLTAQDVVDMAYGAARMELAGTWHGTAADVGAKETQRSFSGRATNAKAQAERILADVGRTDDMAAPSTMQERVRTITEGVKDPKALGKRAFDWVMTQLDSAYPAQEKLRDAMTADQRAMHEYAVAYGTFAQAGHLNGVAGMALQEGGVSFDPNTGHFVARESGNSGRRLHDLQVEMAKTHGMSYEDARRYTIQAWEGRRTLSLYRERDQRLKDANELEAAGKKKQAAAIRDKWEGMKFHITRDAATKLDSLYQVFPELGEITKVKNGMRKWIMDFVVDSGLLSKEKAELLLDNADWVPFKREFDPDETGSMEQFAMAREAFQPSMMRGRAFRGSERSVTDIMDSFDSWALYMMRTAMRNQATKASVAEFMRYGAAKPTSQTKSAGTENRRVRYFADGKPQYVLFDDAPIAAFFNSNIASPRQSAIMAGFNAIFRKSIIGMPTFSLKQLIVDSQEAIIKSGLPAKYAIQIPKLATQEFIKLRSGAATEAHKALTKRGFAGAYTDIAAVRGEELRTVLGYHVTDDKQRSKFMQKWKDAETYGMHMAMHSDNAVRQAIYIAAKDSGMSEAQALNAAADYVNFKRTLSNDTLRAVAAYVPFLTASLSAIRASLMALSGKGITPQERGAALKNYATNMAIVTALSTLWAMANSDDEEYNNMSPEQRARQWTLPGTGGFGIPRRVSVESVVPILSELAVNQMTDKAVDATRMRKATFGLLGEALMPIPEPVPAPVKVLVEQVTNYNSFTGDPVVGTTLNKQDAWKQYGANTSAAARAVGEGMESVGLGNFWFASPTRIDHITRGLLGSVGASGLLLSNMIASKAGDRPEMSTKDLLASIPGFSIPAAKEFNQSDRNDFYDLAERLDKVASTANALLSEGRVEEYQDYVEKNRDKLAMDKAVGRMMDQLNKIRRATKMVRESSMPGRDEEIRRLREVEMRLTQNLNVKGLRVAAGM